jgi:hypothetical protein
VKSRLKILKQHLGALPVSALEKADEINRFKTTSTYSEDNELASVHRVLEVLRTAINWGRALSPPLLSQTPSHRFGVTINMKEERDRDRRVHAGEEQALLATALSQINTPAHAELQALEAIQPPQALLVNVPALTAEQHPDAQKPEPWPHVRNFPDPMSQRCLVRRRLRRYHAARLNCAR